MVWYSVCITVKSVILCTGWFLFGEDDSLVGSGQLIGRRMIRGQSYVHTMAHIHPKEVQAVVEFAFQEVSGILAGRSSSIG